MSDKIKSSGAIIGFLIGLIAVVFLLWSCFSPSDSARMNVIFLLCGGLIGWTTGIFITPGSDVEKTNFSEFGKTITTFSTGFLLAKIEKVFEIAIKDKSDISEIFIYRSLLIVCSFALGVLFTFIWRSYVAPKQQE